MWPVLDCYTWLLFATDIKNICMLTYDAALVCVRMFKILLSSSHDGFGRRAFGAINGRTGGRWFGKVSVGEAAVIDTGTYSSLSTLVWV